MAGRKPNPMDAKTYYQTGNDYYEKGEYEKAIENYNMAILLNPVFSEAYFNRALSYYQLKNFDKAVADYTKSMEFDPQNPIIYNNRGDAFYRKQDFQSAVKDYDKAISLNPNYLKAFYNRGLSYASIEEYEKAVEDFSKVIEIKADFAEAYHLRGLAYEYAGDLASAIVDYEKALELNPDLAEAKTHLENAKSKQEQGGDGKGGKDDEKADIKMLQKPDMTFDDVAGMKKIKDEIKESIVYPMMNPELARKYGKLGGGGILMYGPPGCGKCVRSNTPVILSDGRIKEIREIFELAKSRGEKKLNNDETIIENPGLSVPTLNKETLKMENKKIDYVYRQRYKGKMYTITTHSGRTISTTPEHPFITINNKVVKTKAGELSVGSHIAIPRELNMDAKRKQKSRNMRGINIPEDEMLQHQSFKHPQTRMIKPAYERDGGMSEYFGCVPSEGVANHGTMHFLDSDDKLTSSVAGTTRKMFGIGPGIGNDTSSGIKKVNAESVGLISFPRMVHNFGIRGSRKAGIPESILCAPDQVAARFLSEVFECEAYIRADSPEIELATSSRDFANQTSYLLMRFGIVARIRPKKLKNNNHTCWILHISGHPHLGRFEKNIGLIGERNKKRLKRWTSRQIPNSTNTDIIPGIAGILKDARESTLMNKSSFYGSKNGYMYEMTKNMSRNQLLGILENKKRTKEIKRLERLAESEIMWDEVISIEEEDVDDFVYDLTVGETHTFVAGFGGIITHNTFIVKASAGECDSGFINAKLSDLLDMYVGNTEKNIHKVFELARDNTPCIMFFDEVDAIGGRRDQGEGAQYMKMAVNQMLYEMDGVEANNQNVLVIAATNAPWDVDPALRRSGRFSKTLYISEPDYNSRVAIIKLHAKKRPLSKIIPFWLLGFATMGYASSDLKAIADEAATFPWKEAFFGIQKKTEKYIKQGMEKQKASELAKKKVRQRSVTSGDFVKAICKKNSSLPPWYGQAKKQIGKQEEVTIIDGKEHKKVTDSKMGPSEKEAFKDLLGTIKSQNEWHMKIYLGAVRQISLLILRLYTLATEQRLV